jgi:hypothetical protein
MPGVLAIQNELLETTLARLKILVNYLFTTKFLSRAA